MENEKNIHYKVKTFRLAEETVEVMRRRKPAGLSWNLYFLKLLNPNKKTKGRHKEEGNTGSF